MLTALISASAAVATAITALILNHRGFTALENRSAALEARTDNRFTAMENRLTAMETRFDRRFEAIETDLKEFFKVLA